MTGKDNPPKVPKTQTQEKKIFNSDLKSAFSDTADIFSDRSDAYNQISADIKSTEEFFRDKGLKDLFTLCSEKKWDIKQVELDEYERAMFYPYETLEWRFDSTSKKFRLMVTRYFLDTKKSFNGKWDDYSKGEPMQDFEEIFFYTYNTRPLLECPIPTRVFFNTKLDTFVRCFAQTILKLKKIGRVFEGVVASVNEDQQINFYSHTKQDHEQEIISLEKGIKKTSIYPGGLSDTPIGIVREENIEPEELEKLKNQEIQQEKYVNEILVERRL
tara:strand:+ start:885 stop:1700 length:816 start_codon:yes stop_codon:yes gene_type:complete